MAGRRAAVAPYFYVDLHRYRDFVYRLSDFQRELSAGFVHPARHSRCVADGEALLFLRPKTAVHRSLQSAAEAGLHRRDNSRCSFGFDRASRMEADSIFLAGMDDGRVSLR